LNKIFVITIGLGLMLCLGAKAQNTSSSYRTAIGAKIYFGDGSSGGINIKHFMNRTAALEGSLVFFSGALGVEGLYEYHGNITGARGLKWFTGAGGILAFSTRKHSDESVLFGIRGTAGLDYKITGAPINVAFALDPTFVVAPTDFDFAASLAFRFAL
jgi:hypothetical protein